MADIILPVFGGMFDSTTVVDTVNGFPRGDKAVDSSFFAKMISSFYSDGVLAGGEYGQNGFRVLPEDGLGITVSAGIAWIRGYMAWMQTAQTFALSAGHSYAVLLRLSLVTGEFSLILTEETESLPTDTELIRDLVLAEITIPAGWPMVTEDMITDTRSDAGKCGLVTCTVDALQTVPYAVNAGAVGGFPETAFLHKDGGTMTGDLVAFPKASGTPAVRNIGYGTVLPDVLEEGDIFILLAE